MTKFFWNYLRLYLFISGVVCCFSRGANAQINFEQNWAYSFDSNSSALSVKADQLNRPYLYVTTNDAGLLILDMNANLITTLDKSDLGFEVMNIYQKGEILYLALGSHFAEGPCAAGTLDISDPENPMLLDIWEYEGSEDPNGMAIVIEKNGLLYCGAMGLGLIILDVSDPTEIEFISRLTPDINYPHPNPANEKLYNARGIDIINDTLYLCYDAGGLRTIDISNPSAPFQIGQYANPITYEPFNMPRAYNNVIVVGQTAYVAVDYCGLEAIDITDPGDMFIRDHYNPVNCPQGSWFNAALHTNELVVVEECDQLFVTAGRSELLAFDISDPAELELNGSYGTIEDTTATWGLDIRHDSIFLTYLKIPIYIPFLHPFDSKWSGVRLITYQSNCNPSSIFNFTSEEQLKIFPNPTQGLIHIESEFHDKMGLLQVFDLNGKLIQTHVNNSIPFELELAEQPGIYFLKIIVEDSEIYHKILRL